MGAACSSSKSAKVYITKDEPGDRTPPSQSNKSLKSESVFSGALRTSSSESGVGDPVAGSRQILEKLDGAMQLFVRKDVARVEFVKFVKSGEWIEQLMCKESAEIPAAPSNDAGGIQFGEYVLAPRIRRKSYEESMEHFMSKINLIQQLKISETKFDGSFLFEEIVQSCFTMEQMKPIILASLYPLFVDTKEYLLCLSGSFSDKSLSHGELLKRENRKVKMKDRGSLRIRDIYVEAASAITDDEFDQMLRTGSWLRDFVQTVEDFRLSVSIASAQPSGNGFPLLYVNKAFEDVTQYDRTEVIGRKCKMLQCRTSEHDQLVLMSKCLREGAECKVAICNMRRDGTEFFNLLALSPVYDRQGVYSYVIGIQYDLCRSEATMREVRLIDDFIFILTNILK